jgi:hypothetical protein
LENRRHVCTHDISHEKRFNVYDFICISHPYPPTSNSTSNSLTNILPSRSHILHNPHPSPLFPFSCNTIPKQNTVHISHTTTTHDTFPQPPKSNLIRFSLIDHRQVSECGATHAPKIAHIPSCLPFATLKRVKRARCVTQHPRRPEHVKGVTMKVALLPESWSFVVEGVKGKQNSVKQNLM